MPRTASKPANRKAETANPEPVAIIVGNVGGDPELRFTSGTGKAVTDFSLALYAGKDSDGNKLTEWCKVTVWGKLAETVTGEKGVGKGDKVRASGYLYIEEYTDRNNNQGVQLRLTAFEVTKLERPAKSTGAPA